MGSGETGGSFYGFTGIEVASADTGATLFKPQSIKSSPRRHLPV